ncbi:hypothetical protein H0H93_009766 [Arthromyces matolae]|nr:hypothetical protein H0H93_009766 [Arthromyces matolae]
MTLEEFPIDLSKFDTKLSLDPSKAKLSPEEKRALEANIQLFRDAIVLFTATGAARGVKFSSGRLGHMWPMVNGVALSNRDKTVFCLGSDGSQQEGNDAEAARLAVAQNLNVKLIIDDNDVTIAGHPSQYLKGYSVAKTLEGHGLTVFVGEGENIDSVWDGVRNIVSHDGPAALVLKRTMAPGIPDIEGSTHGHDVIPIKSALAYFKKRGGFPDFTDLYSNIKPLTQPYLHLGSTKEVGANRVIFGEAVNLVLDTLSKEEAAKRVMVIDSDLEGSTGLKVIHQKHPEVFVPSGIMERGNFSAAAGFGFESGKTGLNSFFADNGLSDTHSALYFPADGLQMIAIIKAVIFQKGLRFVFSTRSKVPYILREGAQDTKEGRFFDPENGYVFKPGKDEILKEGKDGYVVTFGEMVYRAWDAVLRLKEEGIDVGLVNKPSLNIVDEETIMKIGQSPFVLVVESFNQKTGLGSKFGTWLLERRLTPKYGYMGSTREGCGGLWEQIPFQGLDPQCEYYYVLSVILNEGLIGDDDNHSDHFEDQATHSLSGYFLFPS